MAMASCSTSTQQKQQQQSKAKAKRSTRQHAAFESSSFEQLRGPLKSTKSCLNLDFEISRFLKI
jgi:hypothetical protein